MFISHSKGCYDRWQCVCWQAHINVIIILKEISISVSKIKHSDVLLIVYLFFQLHNSNATHKVTVWSLCHGRYCQLIMFSVYGEPHLYIQVLHTYCMPIGTVSWPSPGVWVVLLFPFLQSCLPVRSVYPEGRMSDRAEQSCSDRSVSSRQHRHAWARLAGMIVLMQHSAGWKPVAAFRQHLHFLN